MYFFQNTFVLGSFLAFKFRHVLEMFTIQDFNKKNQFTHSVDYNPDNETSIVRSLKGLYDLNPCVMLYKVIIKNNFK